MLRAILGGRPPGPTAAPDRERDAVPAVHGGRLGEAEALLARIAATPRRRPRRLDPGGPAPGRGDGGGLRAGGGGVGSPVRQGTAGALRRRGGEGQSAHRAPRSRGRHRRGPGRTLGIPLVDVEQEPAPLVQGEALQGAQNGIDQPGVTDPGGGVGDGHFFGPVGAGGVGRTGPRKPSPGPVRTRPSPAAAAGAPGASRRGRGPGPRAPGAVRARRRSASPRGRQSRHRRAPRPCNPAANWPPHASAPVAAG